LGFHKCSQDEYLDMVFGYANHLGLYEDKAVIRAEALEWATTRGSRSGRTAWQYIQDLAGRLGKHIA
jgi:predicted AAA+ superfamily ATPase